jgi:hypothetical protein
MGRRRVQPWRSTWPRGAGARAAPPAVTPPRWRDRFRRVAEDPGGPRRTGRDPAAQASARATGGAWRRPSARVTLHPPLVGWRQRWAGPTRRPASVSMRTALLASSPSRSRARRSSGSPPVRQAARSRPSSAPSGSPVIRTRSSWRRSALGSPGRSSPSTLSAPATWRIRPCGASRPRASERSAQCLSWAQSAAACWPRHTVRGRASRSDPHP